MALLALEHKVPIVVVLATNLDEPLRYRVTAEDMIFPEEYDGRADAVAAMTQRYTTALERGIRRAPAQYFWLHRRWKHQPARAKKKVA